MNSYCYSCGLPTLMGDGTCSSCSSYSLCNAFMDPSTAAQGNNDIDIDPYGVPMDLSTAVQGDYRMDMQSVSKLSQYVSPLYFAN